MELVPIIGHLVFIKIYLNLNLYLEIYFWNLAKMDLKKNYDKTNIKLTTPCIAI